MQKEFEGIIEQLRAAFEAGDINAALGVVRDLPPADLAELFLALDREEQIAIVRRLDPEAAAAVLSEVDDRSLPALLDLLADAEIVSMLDNLDSDDAADIVAQLDDEDATRVIAMLDEVDHQDAVELSELLRYPEDSAGGVMAKEFLSVERGSTAGAVVMALRQLSEEELANLHTCFVVDTANRLVGEVRLLKMMLADPRKRIEEIMDPEPMSTGVLVDQEEVANLFRKHDLLSLPVVDTGGRLVGRVTVDDAIDVIAEEADEDAARLAGSSSDELGESSVFRISRARLPWLMMGLFGQLLAAVALSAYEASLQEMVLLTFFIPMVMATGGNVGIQTSTIMIRRLVSSELEGQRPVRDLLREVSVSFINGALMGLVMVLVLWIWKSDLMVGVVIGSALMSVVLIAACVGTLVPILLQRGNIDPTVATGPFITTLNDVLGILAYLGLARWILGF